MSQRLKEFVAQLDEVNYKAFRNCSTKLFQMVGELGPEARLIEIGDLISAIYEREKAKKSPALEKKSCRSTGNTNAPVKHSGKGMGK